MDCYTTVNPHHRRILVRQITGEIGAQWRHWAPFFFVLILGHECPAGAWSRLPHQQSGSEFFILILAVASGEH